MASARLVLATVLLLVSGVLAGADHPLSGGWKHATRADHWMLVEDRMLYLLRDGCATSASVTHEEGAIVYDLFQHREPYVLESGILVLGGERFVRSAEVPPAIRPAPVDDARALPAEVVAEIRAQLSRRFVADKAVRTDPASTAEAWKAVDEPNTAWLRATIERVGWIDVGRFGSDASDAAFLLVQHSGDLTLMRAVLPEIERDVRARRQEGGSYALLYDRVQIFAGRKQRYGSQIQYGPDGGIGVFELEDPATVDALRAGLGLEPLADYLKRFTPDPSKAPKPVGAPIAVPR